MTIVEMKRPTAKRGRKGEMADNLKSLPVNSDKALVLKQNQSSGAYSAAKTAGISISIHKLDGEYEGHVAVFSNGARSK